MAGKPNKNKDQTKPNRLHEIDFFIIDSSVTVTKLCYSEEELMQAGHPRSATCLRWFIKSKPAWALLSREFIDLLY
jgi:hypothetical protein